MTPWSWLHVLAAASGLMVAALALSRAPTNPLALPLSLLALDQFAWNVASVGLVLTGDRRYEWLSAVVAPLFVPFVLHFVVAFVGRSRPLRRLLAAAYAVFGALALYALVDFLVPGHDLAVGTGAHAAPLLFVGLPLAGFMLVLVVRHLRASSNQTERWRARLLLAALVTLTLLLPTDLLAAMGVPVPPLASLGDLAFSAVLTWLMLGLGVVSGSKKAALGQAVLVSLVVVSVYLALFISFREHLGLLLISMTALTLGLVALARLTMTALAQSRAGLERQATLGRFSAQMAHDLKNPLAAARGAAEVLSEEMRRSQQPSSQHLAGLVVQQLDRLNTVIDQYQRLSRLELSPQQVDLNALVRRVLALQGFVAENVAVRADLSPACPSLRADPEMLASALENLLKNAFEAIPKQGVVTVRTVAENGLVRLSVQDDGAGMDPRVLAQAFTVFFTTKATGSGMGLAFVQQVARAHGGEARVESKEGAGTLVELLLPARRGEEAPATGPA